MFCVPRTCRKKNGRGGREDRKIHLIKLWREKGKKPGYSNYHYKPSLLLYGERKEIETRVTCLLTWKPPRGEGGERDFWSAFSLGGGGEATHDWPRQEKRKRKAFPPRKTMRAKPERGSLLWAATRRGELLYFNHIWKERESYLLSERGEGKGIAHRVLLSKIKALVRGEKGEEDLKKG